MHLASPGRPDDRLMQSVKQMISKARRHSIPLVHTLGVVDTKVVTELACEGCDFVQGARIYAQSRY